MCIVKNIQNVWRISLLQTNVCYFLLFSISRANFLCQLTQTFSYKYTYNRVSVFISGNIQVKLINYWAETLFPCHVQITKKINFSVYVSREKEKIQLSVLLKQNYSVPLKTKNLNLSRLVVGWQIRWYVTLTLTLTVSVASNVTD